jgi:RNA polymerase sigma-70 factor, ECF subfamily
VNESTFSELYAEIAKPLWRYVARVSGRRDIADDVLQETFFRFLRSSRTGLSKEETRLYLFRIATNLLNDRWRRSKGTVGLESGEAIARSHLDIALDAERVLQQLKPRARELLWLAYVEGMSHREIAQATGLNVMSVRILLLRARRQARTYLESKGDTHGKRRVPKVD